MYNHKRKFALPIMLSLLVSAFFVSCYPLSTGAVRWRIKFDKEELARKKHFLEDAAVLVNERQPNIILIVADDLGLNDVRIAMAIQ
ncbi:MAG: hypothetical protein R2807_04535 [Chitinophagales bacterium]